jgi:hypothetical protein
MSIVEAGGSGQTVRHAIVNVHAGVVGEPTTGYSFERTGKIFPTLPAMIDALDGIGEPYVASYDETTVTLKNA